MTERINKPFLVLLVIAAAIGVGIGGVFAGGVALGKASEEDTPTALFAGEPTTSATGDTGQDGGGQFNRGQGGPGRFSRSQAGPAPPGSPPGPGGRFDRSDTVPQSPDATSVDAGIQSSSKRGGISGTVERVEGNVVTITTDEGPVEVAIAESTTIGQISQASVDDLQIGVRVTAMGPAGEDGRVQAADLVITPEGLENPFGRGRQGDRNYRPGAGAP